MHATRSAHVNEVNMLPDIQTGKRNNVHIPCHVLRSTNCVSPFGAPSGSKCSCAAAWCSQRHKTKFVFYSSRFSVTLLFTNKAAIDRSYDAAKSSSHQAALCTTSHTSSTQQAKRYAPKNGSDRNGASDNNGAHTLDV